MKLSTQVLNESRQTIAMPLLLCWFVHARNSWKYILDWKIFDIFFPRQLAFWNCFPVLKIGFNILWELKWIPLWRLAFVTRCSYKKRLDFCKVNKLVRTIAALFNYIEKKLSSNLFFNPTKVICWSKPLWIALDKTCLYIKVILISL